MFDCEDFSKGQVGVDSCCWEEAGKGQGSGGHLDLSVPVVRYRELLPGSLQGSNCPLSGPQTNPPTEQLGWAGRSVRDLLLCHVGGEWPALCCSLGANAADVRVSPRCRPIHAAIGCPFVEQRLWGCRPAQARRNLGPSNEVSVVEPASVGPSVTGRAGLFGGESQESFVPESGFLVLQAPE